MKFKLCWWEDNGYHDSYFEGLAFHTDTNTFQEHSLGATAYAGGIGFDRSFQTPTLAILERARLVLAKQIYTKIRGAEWRDVLTPSIHGIELHKHVRLI